MIVFLRGSFPRADELINPGKHDGRAWDYALPRKFASKHGAAINSEFVLLQSSLLHALDSIDSIGVD
jgi:hypothetical protein